MAKAATSKKQGKGKDAAPKPKRETKPVLTLTQATKVMADNRGAYDAYEKARLTLKQEGVSDAARTGLERTMEKNRAGFSAYWRAYNNPHAAAQRKADREAKQAAAAAAASTKAASKKDEPADGLPVETGGGNGGGIS